MLLQLEKVSETSFPAIWRPKIQKISLRCPPWEHFLFMQTVKKLNLCGRTVADKSAWIKAWLHFSHLPLTALKMKIPKQWQKGLEISFYTSVPPNHMLHCSWDMAVGGCNCYCSFGAIFSPFTPLTAQKKKKKKHLEISTLTTSVPKIMITCYTVPEIWCARDVIVIIHFGIIFAFLLPPPSP